MSRPGYRGAVDLCTRTTETGAGDRESMELPRTGFAGIESGLAGLGRSLMWIESERGKPSSHVSMSQCLMSGSMSSRARPLRPRRSSRQGFRGRTSLGETHPNVLSPVARLKIRIPASRRPRSHPKWLNARLKADLLARICVRGKVRKAAQPKLCGRTAMRCRVRAAPRRRWL